ncbi:hypothetical protein HY994_03525 [Candidatus Micrarchaeota archaeon]|nr:hypothetical protein [Candidatus Micrarchaeota archaeon]
MILRNLSFLLLVMILLAGCVSTPSNPPSAPASATSTAPQAASITATPQAGAAPIVSANFKTYSGDTFEMRYPADWTVREEQQFVLFTSPLAGAQDSFQESLNVVLAPTDLTLEAFVQNALGDTFESDSAQLADSRETTLSDLPARQVTYTEKSADATLAYLQIFTVSDGNAAIVTLTSTPDAIAAYQSAAVQIITSFKLKAKSSVSVPAESSMEPEIVRKWRVYSQSIYYDDGGSNFLETPATTLLQLNADQTWSFGSSSGTWSIQPIAETDWQKWGVSSYGPTRKLVLNGWNGGTNDGPIEESGSRVDFMWVIYRVVPPTVSAPGQVQMKFGQTYGG